MCEHSSQSTCFPIPSSPLSLLRALDLGFLWTGGPKSGPMSESPDFGVTSSDLLMIWGLEYKRKGTLGAAGILVFFPDVSLAPGAARMSDPRDLGYSWPSGCPASEPSRCQVQGPQFPPAEADVSPTSSKSLSVYPVWDDLIVCHPRPCFLEVSQHRAAVCILLSCEQCSYFLLQVIPVTCSLSSFPSRSTSCPSRRFFSGFP